MTASYTISKNGIFYCLSSEPDDPLRQMLTFILKNYAGNIFTFPQFTQFFNDNVSVAFKQICSLIENELIDICPEDSTIQEIACQSDLKSILSTLQDEQFLLTDMSGLLITYQGYEVSKAAQIAATARDYMTISSRNFGALLEQDTQSPISVDIIFHNSSLRIYQLNFSNFNCLLATQNPDIYTNLYFINFISYLLNRYDYEHE